MGIISKAINAWKQKTTLQKINLIIDAISSVGCGLASIRVSKKLTEDSPFIEKVLVRTAVTGLGIAAADISGNALKENYGEPLANVISGIREKQEAQEDKANE